MVPLASRRVHHITFEVSMNLRSKGKLRLLAVRIVLAIVSPAAIAVPDITDSPRVDKERTPAPRECQVALDSLPLEIQGEWMRLNGPDGDMGCPLRVNNPAPGRWEVPFDNGTMIQDERVWHRGGV